MKQSNSPTDGVIEKMLTQLLEASTHVCHTPEMKKFLLLRDLFHTALDDASFLSYARESYFPAVKNYLRMKHAGIPPDSPKMRKAIGRMGGVARVY